MSITIRRTALAKRRVGRSELKRFSDWNDSRPETELNFKFYRQATNKIVGISDEQGRSSADSFSKRISTMGTRTIAVLVTIAFSVIGVLGDYFLKGRQRARPAATNRLVLYRVRPLRLDRVRLGVRNEAPEAGHDPACSTSSPWCCYARFGVVLFRESLNYFEVIGIVFAVVSLVLLMRFA